MKILFLDIDGVLNSKEFVESKRYKPTGGTYGMDPQAVKHLYKIVRETKCKIVVSSVWRTHGLDNKSKFYKELAKCENGNVIYDSVIDQTPHGYNHDMLHGSKYQRGDEIKIWLEDNNFQGKFVIVDDDSDMSTLQSHLVKTSFDYGLTENIANEIISRLNNE